MATVLKIRGTNVTAHLRYPSLRWEKDLNARVYICTGVLKSTSSIVPTNDDYVEVTQTDGTTKAWTGIIRQPDETRIRGDVVEFPFRAVGWAGLAKEIRLSNSYTISAGNNDAFILKTVLDLEWGQIRTGASHVLRSRRAFMPASHFAFGTILYDFLDEISRQAFRAAWYIDDDKNLIWNNHRNFAPFALSNTPNGSTLRGHSGLRRYEDHAVSPYRVRVYGEGIISTLTDWVAFGKAARKMRDEAGSPDERFRYLPDVNDQRLTTAAEVNARGFEELELASGHRGYRLQVRDEGLYPGMLIDVMDSAATRLYTRHSTFRRRGRVPASTPDIMDGHGRFLIRRVVATLVSKDTWIYDVEMGDIDPIGGGALGG